MSNILPYNFASQPPPTPTTHDSMTHSTSSSHRFTSSTHVSAITPPPPVTLSSHASSSSLDSTTTTTTTTTPLSALTVAEWAGVKQDTSKYLIYRTRMECMLILSLDHCSQMIPDTQIEESSDWRDVHRNIKRMDQLYDATFYSWLKSEDNVLVTAMYLHRIANEYPLERVANALKWLVSEWRWESTSILVRHVTVDWCDDAGKTEKKRMKGKKKVS